MFQFWNKRTTPNNKKEDEEQNSDCCDENNAMIRTCSMTSDNSSMFNSNCWNIDWKKRNLSFKEDYVSFPALEPSASEVTCSN
jgi:hypothetical protein